MGCGPWGHTEVDTTEHRTARRGNGAGVTSTHLESHLRAKGCLVCGSCSQWKDSVNRRESTIFISTHMNYKKKKCSESPGKRMGPNEPLSGLMPKLTGADN